MALDITYFAGKDSMSFRLSGYDIEVSKCLAQKGLEKEVGALLDVSDFGERTPVNRELLSGAVAKLISSISDDSALLPYTYVIKQEVPRGSGSYSSGTGSISGFKVNGEQFSIEGGLDHCVLYRLNQSKWGDHTYDFDNPIDIRNKKRIKIDDDCREVGGIIFGDIIIERKRKPTKLLKLLGRLKSFLSNTDAEMIEKILG